MATVRRWIDNLLGRTESHKAACEAEERAAEKLNKAAKTTIHHAVPRPARIPRAV